MGRRSVTDAVFEYLVTLAVCHLQDVTINVISALDDKYECIMFSSNNK